MAAPLNRAAPALLAALLLVACGSAAPPTSARLVAHDVATDAAGTLLVTDVCIGFSPLASADYFVVEPSRRGAEALQAAAAEFLAAADLRVRERRIPFVCGARHDRENQPKGVARDVDAEQRQARQPLWVAPEIEADGALVEALGVVATHAFETAVLAALQPPEPVPPTFDATTVRTAAALVAARTGRSSLFYLGVTGTSISTEKAFVSFAGRLAASVALSLAIGPIASVNTATTSYQWHVIYVPGGPVDRRQMVGAMVDLRDGRVVQSQVVHAGGDPMSPDVIASRDALALLLKDAAFARQVR